MNLNDIPPVMMFPSAIIAGILLAYLLGSIPFGIILSRLFRVGDLRKIGSGNIGATNMLRAGGKKLGAAVLLLDMAKGYAAVVLSTLFVHDALTTQNSTLPDNVDIQVFAYMFGLYAVIGHVWPIWLKFKGGKGVATALGVLLAFSLPVGLLAFAAWLAVFALTRYSSLSALVSIGLAPVSCFLILGKPAAIAALLIAFLVFYRHKENISRLLSGTELRFGQKKKS